MKKAARGDSGGLFCVLCYVKLMMNNTFGILLGEGPCHRLGLLPFLSL